MERLYLTKTDSTGCKVLIGELSKNDGIYTFKYTIENSDKSEGFLRVSTFRDFDKVYKSDKLFLFFAHRVFDKARPDLHELLEKYGLKDYNVWEILKATGGRLMTDKYELHSEKP